MTSYSANILRFLLVLIAQILIFNFVRIKWAEIPFIEVFIYPLFLFLLPLRTSHSLLIVLGFGIGLIVDIFQNTPGVHSGAGTFTGLMRPYIIKSLTPRGGYKVHISPTISTTTFRWFAIYCAIMIILHCFAVSLIDIFQFKLLPYVLLRTILTSIVSYVIMMIVMIIFDPKE